MSQKTTLRPLHDRVIVKPDPIAETTEGGMIKPDSAKEKPVRGTVESAGPGLDGKPSQVKKGDVVLYEKNSGTELDVEGETYLMIQEKYIHCVLESTEA